MNKTETRYRKVLENRQRVTGNLMKAMGMTAYNYNLTIFNYGIALLESFWLDSINEPEVHKLYKRMLTDERYWSWFKNQRAMCEVSFSYDIQHKYKLDLNDFGKNKAARKLLHHWVDLHEEMINDDDMMERLRQFIIKHY